MLEKYWWFGFFAVIFLFCYGRYTIYQSILIFCFLEGYPVKVDDAILKPGSAYAPKPLGIVDRGLKTLPFPGTALKIREVIVLNANPKTPTRQTNKMAINRRGKNRRTPTS